jgi:hypothetical protein
MLTYQEMVALSDKCSTVIGGSWSVNIAQLRGELFYNYALSDYQIQHVIFMMKDRGLLPNG